MSSGHKTNIQKNNVSKIERKEKIQESSLYPSKNMNTPFNKNLLNYPSPYKYDYSHLKTTPFFVTSDK